jgi:hypothetical protein
MQNIGPYFSGQKLYGDEMEEYAESRREAEGEIDLWLSRT